MKLLRIDQGWTFWREGGEKTSVTLPHDAMIHEERTADSPAGAAGAWFPPGTYYYTRELDIAEDWSGKHIVLRFDGVYPSAEVTVNGAPAGSHTGGYTPFTLDVSELVRPGEKNTLEVRVDNSDLPNSRWYSGAGIYRPVYVGVGPKGCSITEENVAVVTESASPQSAEIRVRTEGCPKGADVRVEVFYKKNRIVEGNGADCLLTIPEPLLWSDTGADLYTMRVSYVADGKTLDAVKFYFGIRLLEWGKSGLFLNGNRTVLRGGCVHHDNGLLGAATCKEAENRRILRMKEAGFNAVRTAHNPPSEEFLTACDRYGMYVLLDLFDNWYMPRYKGDASESFADTWKATIRAAVLMARNHPSVILYSIGNDLIEPNDQDGLQMARLIMDEVRRYDVSRPLTAGVNLALLSGTSAVNRLFRRFGKKAPAFPLTIPEAARPLNSGAALAAPVVGLLGELPQVGKITAPFCDLLDIAGYNYSVSRWGGDRKKHPGRLILGTEILPSDLPQAAASAESDPGILGGFLWSGWDYLGEAGADTWNTDGAGWFGAPYPWLINGSGAFDILGNPTSLAHYASSVWRFSDKPWIGVHPMNEPGKLLTKSPWRTSNAVDSWSWRGCTHYRTTVEDYTTGSFVKLLLNDETVGISRVHKNKAVFHILYEPGILTAVVCNSRLQEVGASASLRSATGKLRISAAAEQKAAFPGDIVYVPVTLRGENGIRECNCDETLFCTVENGELLGFGSADPCTKERFDTDSATTYFGNALAIVRVGSERTTTVVRFSSAAADQPDETVEISVL